MHDRYTGKYKMKVITLFIVIVSLSFLSFFPVGDNFKVYTTNCHQTFHFFFLSQGSPTFWIGEDLSGECEGSKLINISIKDSIVSYSESELKEYKDWGCIPELSSIFRKYEEQPLELKGNIWENESLEISPPDYDSVLAEEFNEHILHGGSSAYSWFNLKGNNGIILPKIERRNTRLLFSYKPGLYINYQISEVHYFPDNYLIVFTKQPLKADGLDTMDGFLIFKII